MISDEVVVLLSSGLHARTATKFVNLAKSFHSEITIEFNGTTIDPTSIVDILSAGIFCNDKIVLSASGEDEAKAVKALTEFIRNKD